MTSSLCDIILLPLHHPPITSSCCDIIIPMMSSSCHDIIDFPPSIFWESCPSLRDIRHRATAQLCPGVPTCAQMCPAVPPSLYPRAPCVTPTPPPESNIVFSLDSLFFFCWELTPLAFPAPWANRAVCLRVCSAHPKYLPAKRTPSPGTCY